MSLTHNHHRRRRHHHHMAPSFFTFSLFILLLLSQHSLSIGTFGVTFTDNNNTQTSQPPNPIPANTATTVTSFKLSIAIFVSIFTIIFTLTFLLLLFIKHIDNITTTTTTTGDITNIGGGRKNSGIDLSVIESLPTFKFESLKGEKDGLDCAVCLLKFKSVEILRLLPKCKHVFHVECIDLWLNSHSTCPLCRYRVDPEDILIVVEEDSSIIQIQNEKQEIDECVVEIERRMTRNEIVENYHKRHSSVGEKEWEREVERERKETKSFRFSLDGSRTKNESSSVGLGRGLGLGRLVGPRKDGMLLTKEQERCSVEGCKRLEHRIIVSPSGVHMNHRWSDVAPCDLLYLTSEMMIMSESSSRIVKKKNKKNDNGRDVINLRSVSEITGLSRFRNNNSSSGGKQNNVVFSNTPN